MPGFYQGGAVGRIINRNPTTGRGSGDQMNPSRSRVVGGPQIEPLNSETGSQWSPYGMFVSHPFRLGLPRSLMAVEQATGFLDSSPNGWPQNGVADYPNAQQAITFMKLPHTTSAHHGFMMPTGPGPNMVFFSPPVWGLQTRPLYATGAR